VFGLIHADLLPSNVLVRADGAVAAIDFDDTAFGYYLYDLVVAVSELTDQPQFPALCDALLAGYERHRSLSGEDRSLVPVFLLIRCLVEIGWFDSRLRGHLTYDRGGGSTREALIPPIARRALSLIEQTRPLLT
jgi:Ser/Thr protein kinase RdoA (MazF antagonist)